MQGHAKLVPGGLKPWEMGMKNGAALQALGSSLHGLGCMGSVSVSGFPASTISQALVVPVVIICLCWGETQGPSVQLQ